MRLIKIEIENFRCYKAKTEIEVCDLTAIIGKNDIGKSALLDALDAFFNDKIEKSDICADTSSDIVEISCFFEGLPGQLVLDTTEPTSPAEEGILNPNGQLQVKKRITFGARKSVAVFLVAEHPSDDRIADLLNKKNGALKALAEELGVDLEGVNKRKNPPIRQRIREHVGGGREVSEIKVDGSLGTEDNLKAIWTSLKKYLPVFSLFKNDKEFDDKDGDIRDPMQEAVKEALALSEIRDLLSQVEEKVKEFSTDVADRTIEKLKRFDASLSENMRSEFGKDPSYSKVFDLTLLNERGVPLNKRGSGVRRLVILSFFQAQVERRRLESGAPSAIYAIEEPETSQHPNHQQMIIDALIDLANDDDVQVLFTTHSANLAREIPLPSLRYISLNDEDEVVIESGSRAGEPNPEVLDRIVAALGILPNPADLVKLLLYVEGHHDVNALVGYSQLLHAGDGTVLDLSSSSDVAFVITGGSALKHYLDCRYLEGLGKPELHIYDNDVGEYRAAVQRINRLADPKKRAFNTVKLEMESYLHPDAIVEAYREDGLTIAGLGPFNDDSDVPLEVAKAIYESEGGVWAEVDSEKRKELANRRKKKLNTAAVGRMTVERLGDASVGEMKNWLATAVELMGQ